MRTSQGTAALLALEDASPDILFHTVPGTDVPIWPHVRMAMAQAMAAVELGSESVSDLSRAGTWHLVKRHLAAYVPTRRQPTSLSSGGLCFFVGGTTVRTTARGLENWLVDDFARTDARAAVFQDRPLRGRPVLANTFSLDADFARLDVAHRLRPLAEPPREAVSRVVKECGDRLDVPIAAEVLESIVHSASYSLSRIDRVQRVFARVLDRMQPDVVVMEDASYGSYGHVIQMMKARGIHVVEPQHGWIGPSHAAYNFGAAMHTPQLFVTLPDALLTFGDFWSSIVRHPGDIVSIGKPHMNEMSRHVPALDKRPRAVLIASSVSATEETTDFVLAVRDALPQDWSVIYRVHPSERSTQSNRYPRLVGVAGVEFDTNTDVYESMKSSRAVIGVASTVLYEAVAMGCHVFVRDSPFAQYYIDDVFGAPLAGAEGIAHMAEALVSGAQPSMNASIRDRYWKPDGVKNFVAYVQNCRAPESLRPEVGT